MPPQDRVGRHQRGYLRQRVSTETMAAVRESAALEIGQPQMPPTDVLFEDAVLALKYAMTSSWWRFIQPASATARSSAGRRRPWT